MILTEKDILDNHSL